MELVVTSVVAIAGILIIWILAKLIRIVPFFRRSDPLAAKDLVSSYQNEENYDFGDGVVLGEVREVDEGRSIADMIDSLASPEADHAYSESAEIMQSTDKQTSELDVDSDAGSEEIFSEARFAEHAESVESEESGLHYEARSEVQEQGQSDELMIDQAQGVIPAEVQGQEFAVSQENESADSPVDAILPMAEFEEMHPSSTSEEIDAVEQFGDETPYIAEKTELPFNDSGIDDFERPENRQPLPPNGTPEGASPFFNRHGKLSARDYEAQRSQYEKLRNSNDRVIDAVAWLPSDNRVISRMEVLTAYYNCDIRLTAAHQIMGVSCESSDRLSSVFDDEEFTKYTDLYLTMQLVDSHGPVSAKHCLRFQDLVMRMASSLSRDYQYSIAPEETVAEARMLKKAVDELRNEAVLVLMFKVPTFTDIGYNYIVGEYGFERGADGAYVRVSDRNSAVPNFYLIDSKLGARFFSLPLDQSNEHKALIMYSNLPCVNNPVRAFDEMLDAAEDLADRLDARLVDRNFNAIDRDQIPYIRKDIEQYRRDMVKLGITPGGDAAMRLFYASHSKQPANPSFQFDILDKVV